MPGAFVVVFVKSIHVPEAAVMRFPCVSRIRRFEAPSNKATPMGLPSSSIQHRDSRVLDTLGFTPNRTGPRATTPLGITSFRCFDFVDERADFSVDLGCGDALAAIKGRCAFEDVGLELLENRAYC